MSQIPNVGNLLNHLAQLKLMITASHVFQHTQKATLPGVYASSMNGRNSGASHANIYPEDLLIHSHPISVLDYWLAAFVLEAKSQDGNYYPGNAIRNIFATHSHFLKENVGVKSAPNFIREKLTFLACTMPLIVI